MRKNNISKKLLDHFKNLRLILSIGMIVCLTLLNLYWFYTYRILGFFIFFQIFILALTSISHFLNWYGFSSNPKLIEWDTNGIKMISLRNKEEFFAWKDVRDIIRVNDVNGTDFLNRKFPDFIMFISGKLYNGRFLEPEIAKELIDAWQKYGEGPPNEYKPPGCRGRG